MSPHRTGGDSGSYIIDRRFPSVGRIRISSGTDSLKLYRQRVVLLEKLAKQERYALLRALKAGRVTIHQLVEADAEDRLGRSTADILLGEPLWPTAERTINAMKADHATKRRYGISFRSLQRKAAKHLPANARVLDLALVPWSDLRSEWDASATDWMHLKRAVSRFLSELLGDKYHPFARAFRQGFPGRKVKPRRPNLGVAQFRKIVAHAPEHAAVSYWTLAVTGLRVGEYLALKPHHLDSDDECTISVPGTKTERSENPITLDPRVWGLVKAGIPSKLGYAWLGKHWRKACEAAGVTNVHLHDLRHCAGQWAIQGGATEIDVQDFLRHENAAQTRDYVRRGVTLAVSSAIADQLNPQKRKRA